MDNYTLKVTDKSPDGKFGTVFDSEFTAEDVPSLFIQIHEYTAGEGYPNHELDLCIKSVKGEVNVSWQKYITEGFELDGIFYTDNEDSQNNGNYWF